MADVITFQARARLMRADTATKTVVFSEAFVVDDKNDEDVVSCELHYRVSLAIKTNHPLYKFAGWINRPFIIGTVSV